MPRQSLLSQPGRVESLALLGGPLCLDFVNTVDPRHGEQSAEYLTSYRDLVRWAQHAGALPAADAAQLLERGRRDPEGAGQAFVRAIELRDRLYDAFSALADRSSVGADALAAINDGLAAAAGHCPPRRRIGREVRLEVGRRRGLRPGLVARCPLRRRVPHHRTVRPAPRMPRTRRLRLVVLRHQQERQPALVQHAGLRQPGQGPASLRA